MRSVSFIKTLIVSLIELFSEVERPRSGPFRCSRRLMARFQLVPVRLNWTVLLIVAHFTYLLVGATIFQILEREAESNNRNYFQVEKLNFLANYTCLDKPALEKFVQVEFHLRSSRNSCHISAMGISRHREIGKINCMLRCTAINGVTVT